MQKDARSSHASGSGENAYGKYNIGAVHTIKGSRKPTIDEKGCLSDHKVTNQQRCKGTKENHRKKRLKIKQMPIRRNTMAVSIKKVPPDLYGKKQPRMFL
ncbi:hypothetical protein GCM10020331_085780 [Ectobacillus funiculus]